MDYEQKYLKYKIKYLKLQLNQQTGGKQITWPKDSHNILPNSKVRVMDIKVREIKSGLQMGQNTLNRLKNIAGEEHYFTVRDSNNTMLRLLREPNVKTGENEYDFNIQFFESIVLDKLTNQESMLSNKKEENPIEKKIKMLEERLNTLEKNLKQHYHILPTSGAKGFEEAHPYFPRND